MKAKEKTVELAKAYLRRRGYQVKEPNDSKADVVAFDAKTGETVLFETDVSHDGTDGIPALLVDAKREKALKAKAESYGAQRLDVIAIAWPTPTKAKLRHLIGVYQA